MEGVIYTVLFINKNAVEKVLLAKVDYSQSILILWMFSAIDSELLAAINCHFRTW